MPKLDTSASFQLADWQIRPASSEISRNGEIHQLEPRTMAVLQVLAANQGEVLSREQLENAAWKDMIVGYDALTKAINKLREALGDDKKAPRYIQTISKKGYRLVAEVSEISTESSNTVTDEQTGKTSQPPGSENSDRKVNSPLRTTPAFILISIFVFSLGVYFLSKSSIFEQDKTTADIQTTSTLQQQDKLPIVVVIPLRNISANEDNEYLADGLTSDLVTDLSKLSGIRVVSSRSMLARKQSNLTPEQAQQEFNARYVMDGDIIRAKNRIRINVRLSDMHKGTVLWANRYDRDFSDLFAIQDELRDKILASLHITLNKEEKQRFAKRYTNSMAAYDFFLKGYAHVYKRTAEDNALAKVYYRKALDIDPGFARAMGALSHTYSLDVFRQFPSDVDDPIKESIRLAEKAIAMDNTLSETHWVAGYAYIHSGQLDLSHAAFTRALTLKPNYADAMAMMGTLYVLKGQPEQGIIYSTKALELNPEGGYLYYVQAGRIRYFANDYEEAVAYLEKGRKRHPTYIDSLVYLAASLVQLQRDEEASWIYQEILNSTPGFNANTWLSSQPYRIEAYRNKLLKDLKRVEEVALQVKQ